MNHTGRQGLSVIRYCHFEESSTRTLNGCSKFTVAFDEHLDSSQGLGMTTLPGGRAITERPCAGRAATTSTSRPIA